MKCVSSTLVKKKKKKQDTLTLIDVLNSIVKFYLNAVENYCNISPDHGGSCLTFVDSPPFVTGSIQPYSKLY